MFTTMPFWRMSGEAAAGSNRLLGVGKPSSIVETQMYLKLMHAPLEQKPVLHRLMQLYLYDTSEFTGDDPNADGVFDYRYFDEYWQEPDRFPFLIYCGGNLAGFVLVNAYTVVLEPGTGKSIAEFFVMRKYRSQGVGRRAAFHAFDRFPGLWEVREHVDNLAGQAFWRTIIGEYTCGNFTEDTLNTPSWTGPVQTFDNSRGSQVNA